MPWKHLLPCLLMLFFTASGCSVGMAMSGQEPQDTSVVYPGSPRSVVIAKLGPPETSKKNGDGTYTDSYLIVKGNAPSTGRAVAHGALDVLTLGAWELVGTPMELGAGYERKSRLVIRYDGNHEIADVQETSVEKEG